MVVILTIFCFYLPYVSANKVTEF